MKYTLIGNFQYDLGIYGLKKVLDFFKEKYQTDGRFYIEVDKKPEELLELVILKLIYNEDLTYFFYKVVETLFKNNKEIKKKIESLKKENSIKFTQNIKNIVKENKNLEKVINKISKEINFKIKEVLDVNIAIKDIEDIIWNKSVNLLNNVLLNFQADMKVKGKETLKKAIEKLYKDIEEKKLCSFCGENSGKRITRDTFFFAPAQYNAFWFNEPSIFICPHCLVSNLAITQSFTFLGNKIDAVVVYRANLEDLENINDSLKIEDIGEITQKIIDYEKFLLKKKATLNDLQIIEFVLDSQSPHMEFYLLTEDIIRKLLKVEDNINKLYNKYKDSLWGQVKDKTGYKTVNLSKEILKYLTNNQKLFYLVQRFTKLSIMAEIFRENKTKNPPVKGFYVSVLLEILKMHFVLEENLEMKHFEAFKEYGQFLRGKVLSQLSEGGNINWNTFNNKIIALANSFLDASKGSFEQFMETLTRVMISYDAPINTDHLKMINRNTYKEIATTIALALMTEKSKDSKQKDKEVEGISI